MNDEELASELALARELINRERRLLLTIGAAIAFGLLLLLGRWMDSAVAPTEACAEARAALPATRVASSTPQWLTVQLEPRVERHQPEFEQVTIGRAGTVVEDDVWIPSARPQHAGPVCGGVHGY